MGFGTFRFASVLSHSDNKRVSGYGTSCLLPNLLRFARTSDTRWPLGDAQGKQKIPADFFIGKWGGTISGEIVDKQPHKPIKKYPFSIVLIGKPGKLIGPFGGGTLATMRMNATWPGKFTVVYDSVMCMIYPNVDPPVFNFMYPVSNPATIAEMGYNTIFYLAGFSVEVKNTNLILLTSGGVETDAWEDSCAKGRLYRIPEKKCEKKDILSVDGIISSKFVDTVKTYPNGASIRKTHDVIKITSAEGCVELCIKDYFKIVGRDGTEFEISISKLLDGVIESNVYKGYIQVDVWREGKHHQFTTKDATIEISGTSFTIEIIDGGLTIITVLDGEAKISDINSKKTVVLKKNQMSICQQGGLPSDPVDINPNQVFKWWE